MPLLADPARMREIGHAALEVLRAEPRTDPDRIAAIGYGTGGGIALELGRDGVDLRAIATVNALMTGEAFPILWTVTTKDIGLQGDDHGWVVPGGGLLRSTRRRRYSL
jgi:hypothetical protein